MNRRPVAPVQNKELSYDLNTPSGGGDRGLWGVTLLSVVGGLAFVCLGYFVGMGVFEKVRNDVAMWRKQPLIASLS